VGFGSGCGVWRSGFRFGNLDFGFDVNQKILGWLDWVSWLWSGRREPEHHTVDYMPFIKVVRTQSAVCGTNLAT
jgi:hypothetical protein